MKPIVEFRYIFYQGWSETRSASSSLLSNFASYYTIVRVQVNQEELKLNGTHQLRVYDSNVNLEKT